MYLLKRTDHGGGYVSENGHKASYTNNLRYAKKYHTKEQAENDRCIENEVIVLLDDALGI